MVTETDRNIFLTGKAGTGKTTFLKFLKEHCNKNMVVVAPTGVAAINAGGVTIHSFFQLPLGLYLPDAKKGFGLNEHVVDRNTLLKNLRINGVKRKIFQELELLVIDEVSMLRCDTLDEIDTALRYIRKSNLPFGGVQVLFIGDLYQLPPVVNDRDKDLLDEHYKSPFFFQAKVLQQSTPVFIELKKIYRQNEQAFIDILNRLRNNQLNPEDYDLLNKRYHPNFRDRDNRYITLTTHNAKADAINREELFKLNTITHEFKGEVKGDFGDKQYPTALELKLKEGAQVMFIKNDSSPEKRYYNGKIVTICKIEDGEIWVKFPDTDEVLQVEQETWDNISYTHNDEKNEIEEKIAGSFTQYPLRLAWAITIHKSQGLTFENAIIDAGESFAPGQVYVALSRCTSLDGLVLHSRITPRALHTDNRIYHFNSGELDPESLTQLLNEEKIKYQQKVLQAMFDWHKMKDYAYQLEEATLITKNLRENEKIIATIKDFVTQCHEQEIVANKFRSELQMLMNDAIFTKDERKISDRAAKAIAYFTKQIHENLLQPLQQYAASLDSKQRTKKYMAIVQQVESGWWHKMDTLQKASYNGALIATDLQPFKKDKAIEVIKKKTAGDSAKESLAYFMAGKSIEEIAKIRGYVNSTIENHLFQYVQNGELEISRFLEEADLEKIRVAHEAMQSETDAGLTALRDRLDGAYTWTQLRMALGHLKRMQTV